MCLIHTISEALIWQLKWRGAEAGQGKWGKNGPAFQAVGSVAPPPIIMMHKAAVVHTNHPNTNEIVLPVVLVVYSWF